MIDGIPNCNDTGDVVQQGHLAVAADFIRYCTLDRKTSEEAFPGIEALTSDDATEQLTTAYMNTARNELQTLLKTSVTKVGILFATGLSLIKQLTLIKQ